MRASPLLIALSLAAAGFVPRTSLAKPSPEPATAASAENDIAADYQVGKEDVIDISVFKFPELDGPQTVRPDGKISMKLIGEGTFNREDRQKAMKFAFRQAGVACVTVGYKSTGEIDEAIENLNMALV